MVALRALSHHANAAVLFDEAEDLFEPSSLGDNHRSSKLSKAWLNQFLETTTVPVIWTSNLISHMEPSVLRRFMVLQEFRTPPANVRLKMAQKHLLPLGLDMMDVRAIADLPMLTPAQIELTAKTIHLASPNGVTEARAWTNHHLASSRRALGHSIGSNRHPVDVQFDPRYLNTRNGPSVDKLLQHMEADPAISLCLYGLPGTGKTEFARYLAQQLGRELVVRSASDLLSKWVGDTEQKIAAMFEECADYPHETVLLLDEADTFLRNRLTARSTWEVSHTNEFLARMALFPGTFICTTNLFEELDCAVLRRFQFRVQFDAMKPEQVNALFEATFEMKVPVDFSKLTGLVPADFSNVKRQLKFLDGEYDVKALLDLLQVESITRKGQSLTKASIGFL
jgi:SpoVK/Ycf46/Vps4 family AAA+-type ATPase